MPTFSANEAKQNFSKVTAVALVQPVAITDQGRVILEVMTPSEKERIIQARIKEALFSRFIEDAVNANTHYQATGLHTTHAEMTSWLQSLAQNPNNKPPPYHK